MARNSMTPAMMALAGVAAFLTATLAAGPALAAGDVAKGKMAFAICSGCHDLTATNKLGPPLQGVVGRKAGSVPNVHYSTALAQSNFVWTPQKLDQFLTDPAKMVPGTRMPYRITDPVKRTDVVAYLATLKKK